MSSRRTTTNCKLENYSSWGAASGKKHPFEVGDEFEIQYVTSNPNWKETEDLSWLDWFVTHSWINIVKHGCTYTVGLVSKNRVDTQLTTPDYVFSICKKKLNDCIRSLRKGTNYSVLKKRKPNPYGLVVDNQAGCKNVCTGIDFVKGTTRERIPVFKTWKKGTLKYVHVKILDYILNNAVSQRINSRGDRHLVTNTPLQFQLLAHWNPFKEQGLLPTKTAHHNCQSFTKFFVDYPYYLYKLLYLDSYDARIQKDVSTVEKQMIRLRWKILKSQLEKAVQMERTQRLEKQLSQFIHLRDQAIKELEDDTPRKKKEIQFWNGKIQEWEQRIGPLQLHQCKGITREGKRCQNQIKNRYYCHLHQKQSPNKHLHQQIKFFKRQLNILQNIQT